MRFIDRSLKVVDDVSAFAALDNQDDLNIGSGRWPEDAPSQRCKDANLDEIRGGQGDDGQGPLDMGDAFLMKPYASAGGFDQESNFDKRQAQAANLHPRRER
jgi:hypothetical protein